jgi:hypothetical protein
MTLYRYYRLCLQGCSITLLIMARSMRRITTTSSTNTANHHNTLAYHITISAFGTPYYYLVYITSYIRTLSSIFIIMRLAYVHFLYLSRLPEKKWREFLCPIFQLNCTNAKLLEQKWVRKYYRPGCRITLSYNY